MKIALAQINTTIGDISGNVEKILQFAKNAKSEGAELIIYPELTICGYPPGDLLLKESFVNENLSALDELKEKMPIAAIIGFVDRNYERGRPLYNACAFIQDGEIKAKQYKTLLPTYDVFDEDRYFQSADEYSCVSLGDLKFGTTICEDAWSANLISENEKDEVKELKHVFATGQIVLHGTYVHGLNSRYSLDPIEKVVAMKPDFVINIAASPFAAGKHLLRENLFRYHAKKWSMPIVFVNQVGGNDELVFDGRSFVLDKTGKMVALASAFTEDLLIVDIDDTSKKIDGPINQRKDQDRREIYDALITGTRDYVHKCGFKDVVLGVSGGIDSAVVAVIACKALGPEHVFGLNMPSPYSSPGSITDSQQLAKNLGMSLTSVPIDKAMHEFDEMLEQSFSGKQTDVTEENIQARLRGAVLMAFSNKFKRMLLTTGNKSELAVGYCTLYGDMCGGLAVISDLPKMRVYELARLINEEAGYDLIPKSTIEKAPSAELSPNQKDEDTLPPYPVLDAILQAYIEEGKALEQIIQSGYAPNMAASVVAMVERNEFKRRQAAPGLKLTTRAFGFGWRVPVAQRYSELTDKQKFNMS